MTRTIVLLLCFLWASCWSFYGNPEPPPRNVMGYKPVYSNDSSLLRIYSDTARAVKLAGKIYTIGNFILQNEVGSGIHVIDKTDPTRLVNSGFIRIPGNTELSVRGTLLYANSNSDLVVIDVSNYKSVKEVSRVKYAFRLGNGQFYGFSIPPPEHGVYYECLSFGQGIHSGWTKDSVSTYSCYYP